MSGFNPGRPEAGEFASFYAHYIALVPETDIVAALSVQLDEALALLRGLPEETANTRHAPYAWSVKQVVGHITDGERIFSCRALRFGRNDPTPLPGFDDGPYVDSGGFDACRFDELLGGFEFVRRSSIALFRQMPSEAWLRSGVASNNPVTVRALAYVIAGHARHHLNILRKRLSR